MTISRTATWLATSTLMLACAKSVPAPSNPTAASTEPAPSSNASTPSDQAPQQVKLSFGWKPGLRLRVQERIVSTGEDERTEIRASRHLAIEQGPKGLVISPSNGQAKVETTPAPKDPNQQAFLEKLLSQALATIHVGHDGQFQEATLNPQELDRAVASLFDDKPDGEDKDMMKGIAAGMSQMMARQAQEDATRDFREMVGYWNGRELSQGQTIEVSATYPGGTMFGELPVSSKLRFEGYAPCHEGSTEATCAKLSIESTLSPGKAEKTAFRVSELLYRRQLIVEPTTLLPHFTSWQVELVAELESGEQTIKVAQSGEGERHVTYAK